MESALDVKKWSNRFDNLDEEADLKRMLAALEDENGKLKQLVVRLSETILRHVAGRP
jgi:hypothetical protein